MTAGFKSPLSRLDLVCEPSAMRSARAYAKDMFQQWAVPRDVVADALLVVAELATNAVRHSGGPAGPDDARQGRAGVRRCALVLGLVPGLLIIAFNDESDQPPLLRQGSSFEESGRGLQLIAGLTGGAWGWRLLAPQPGKSIWAKIAVPDHPCAQQPLPSSGDRSPRELERARDLALNGDGHMRQNTRPRLGSRRQQRTTRLPPPLLNRTTGNRQPVVLPTVFASTEETVIATQHSTGNAEPGTRPDQPAPFSTPGRWTITTVNGAEVSGYLPAWAEDDPSEAGVPLKMLGVRLADVSHRGFFEGQVVDVVAPDAKGQAVEEALFEGSIDCNPYAVDPEPRVPVVNIHICPAHWMLGLDPRGVAEIAAQLRAQADRLEHEVRPALIAARTDWAAHAPQPTGHPPQP